MSVYIIFINSLCMEIYTFTSTVRAANLSASFQIQRGQCMSWVIQHFVIYIQKTFAVLNHLNVVVD